MGLMFLKPSLRLKRCRFWRQSERLSTLEWPETLEKPPSHDFSSSPRLRRLFFVAAADRDSWYWPPHLATSFCSFSPCPPGDFVFGSKFTISATTDVLFWCMGIWIDLASVDRLLRRIKLLLRLQSLPNLAVASRRRRLAFSRHRCSQNFSFCSFGREFWLNLVRCSCSLLFVFSSIGGRTVVAKWFTSVVLDVHGFSVKLGNFSALSWPLLLVWNCKFVN